MKHFDDLTKIDVPFGDNLKSIRKQKRMTQRELSGLTGLSEAALSQFEKNKRQPNLKSLKLLCSALRLSYAELFGEVKVKPTPMTRQQVLEKYNVVVTEDRKG
jgi:transcriptional regulator with XRE-family HTH domain